MAQVTLREYLQEIEDALSSGHVESASGQCQEVLVQFPESLEVQRLLGEVYLAQGHMEEAQQALDWILTNDPENVIAYCDRALISERTSDFDTALDCYQQAYELSRGNRHIRQQFNMLSAQAGQQGFMFSRAGLARLYMRGGLLPQAAQEWDAVLAVNPDRLDARTGLLETYWREEQFDEAEQVALQTLQDVPGCVKALLILAHITAPKNMQQAQEYVQRAELLDPDLSMAQELFEDMMMSQPGHPFLKLLRKTPAVVDTKQDFDSPVSSSRGAESAFAQVPVSEGPVVVPDALLNGMASSSYPFEWSSLDTWNSGVDTLTKPESNGQPVSDVSALPTWSHETFSSNDVWTLPEQPQREQDAPPFPVQALDGFQFDPWSVHTQNNVPSAPEQQEPQLWSGDMSHFSEHTGDGVLRQENDPVESTNSSWMPGMQDEPSNAAPAWLSMLTQDEQKTSPQQDEAILPVVEHEQQQPPVEIPASPVPQQSVEMSPADDSASAEWREALQTSLNTTDTLPSDETDEESLSFGPEWLKSLGATEIGADVQEQNVQEPVAEPELSHDVQEWSQPASITEPEQPQDTDDRSEPAQSPVAEPQPDTYDWSKYLSPELQATEQPEQTLVNTLEGLEDSLRSQGFVPLEPNSLSAIAQSQGQELAADETQLALPQQPEEEAYSEPYQHPHYDEATLSSALAQLGNLATPYMQPAYPASEILLPAAQGTAMTDTTTEEPSWISSLRSVPAPAEEVTHDAWSESHYTTPTHVEVPGKLTFDSAPASEQPFTVPNHVEAPPTMPAFEPTYLEPQAEVPYVPVAPAARTDALLESELETTMKRPSIRLQAMSQQQRAAAPSQYQTTGRGSEPRSMAGTGRGNVPSFQERLVKGYQHQLVGDYDEAMQEYRIIIKSAPELLNDVASNVRALLKIAPNYSAGYRVLGDAYMRQGEYLQAMEAYNKALTMAKKAKV